MVDERSFKKKRKRIDGMKKGVYIIPSLFTSTSLFCGFYSIISTIHEAYLVASVFILISALLDSLDGRIARLTNTTSRFGMEYDSLSDVIAFVLAPGVLVFSWALVPFGRFGWLGVFLFVACGALRLARYNVQANTIESQNFTGLPTPAAAGVIATLVILFIYLGKSGSTKHITVLILIYVLAFLMISNVKYYGFKHINFFGRHPFYVLVASLFLIVIVAMEPQIVLFLSFFFYTLSGPIMYFFSLKKRVVDARSLKRVKM
ncbi:MAG: CDP-diacylglycerol--serine O-phosphatidyltransferase [Thermodesulfobacteriota bacterium]|nr:CDP-diacylglycerol--serine O-phosphatidyltransferase [Thermodesulfobacteriota bacterium]